MCNAFPTESSSGKELLIDNNTVTEMSISKFQFLEIGFAFMLIANIRIYISWGFFGKIVSTKRILCTSNLTYSRCFLWLNTSRFLNTCSVLLFFFDITTLLQVYVHLWLWRKILCVWWTATKIDVFKTNYAFSILNG